MKPKMSKRGECILWSVVISLMMAASYAAVRIVIHDHQECDALGGIDTRQGCFKKECQIKVPDAY